MDGAVDIDRVTTVMPLRNVMLLAELIERVRSRDPDLPGMACFSGPSGLGKTKAAAWSANEYGCYHVVIKESWSVKKFASKIVECMGMTPKGTIGDMVDMAGEELAKAGRPLLLDEAHLLERPKMMGVVYDIYESSAGGTVVLIGEELLPQTIARWERIHNRMLDWVQAQPCDLREVGLLARLKCPSLSLSDEVLQVVLERSQARARRIVVNLRQISEHALKIDKRDIGVADIEHVRFFTGEAPRPRGNI
jgi:hypothetical protein